MQPAATKQGNNDIQSDFVTISEAARILDLNRSTIQRNVKNNPQLKKDAAATGRAIRISLTALKLFRNDNIDPTKAGNHAGTASQIESQDSDLLSPANSEPGNGDPSFSVWKTRNEKATAERKELLLRREAGELVEVSKIQDILTGCFKTLETNIMNVPKRVAGDLVTMTDRREILVLLEEQQAAALKSASEQILELMENEQ